MEIAMACVLIRLLLLILISSASSFAIPPPRPSLCSSQGKLPVYLVEPLQFCAYIVGFTCCNATDDAVLSGEFKAWNIPQPEAMAVKKSICERRCRPRGLPDGVRAPPPPAGYDDSTPPLTRAVQDLVPAQFSWLLLIGLFALYGLYRAWNKFVNFCSASGPEASSADTPHSELLCGLRSYINCLCCSTVTKVDNNDFYYDDSRVALFGEPDHRRVINSIQMSRV